MPFRKVGCNRGGGGVGVLGGGYSALQQALLQLHLGDQQFYYPLLPTITYNYLPTLMLEFRRYSAIAWLPFRKVGCNRGGGGVGVLGGYSELKCYENLIKNSSSGCVFGPIHHCINWHWSYGSTTTRQWDQESVSWNIHGLAPLIYKLDVNWQNIKRQCCHGKLSSCATAKVFTADSP